MDKISYGRQFIDDEDIKLVIEALKSDSITQGQYVPLFEKLLSEYTGARYAVCVSSGTAALHIIYHALGLGKEDEIITTPNTFAATSNACLYLGGKPRFADISLDDFLIDLNYIEKLINKNTKIIVPVHYAGLTCNMQDIKNIADKYNLYVVEDACHSIGSFYKGSRTGSLKYSNAAVFSFHPVKHITTAEGGAILLQDESLYKKCIALRSHGIVRENFQKTPTSPTYHEMQMLGYNYRITDLQAALGISQLKKLDGFIKRRHEIVEVYNNAFKDMNIKTQKIYDDRINSQHLFPVLFESKTIRDKVYYYLKENNIFTQVHYIPVTCHPYYEQLGYSYKDTPKAYEFYERELSLPIYPSLTDSQLEFVIDNIKKALAS